MQQMVILAQSPGNCCQGLIQWKPDLSLVTVVHLLQLFRVRKNDAMVYDEVNISTSLMSNKMNIWYTDCSMAYILWLVFKYVEAVLSPPKQLGSKSNLNL